MDSASLSEQYQAIVTNLEWIVKQVQTAQKNEFGIHELKKDQKFIYTKITKVAEMMKLIHRQLTQEIIAPAVALIKTVKDIFDGHQPFNFTIVKELGNQLEQVKTAVDSGLRRLESRRTLNTIRLQQRRVAPPIPSFEDPSEDNDSWGGNATWSQHRARVQVQRGGAATTRRQTLNPNRLAITSNQIAQDEHLRQQRERELERKERERREAEIRDLQERDRIIRERERERLRLEREELDRQRELELERHRQLIRERERQRLDEERRRVWDNQQHEQSQEIRRLERRKQMEFEQKSEADNSIKNATVRWTKDKRKSRSLNGSKAKKKDSKKKTKSTLNKSIDNQLNGSATLPSKRVGTPVGPYVPPRPSRQPPALPPTAVTTRKPSTFSVTASTGASPANQQNPSSIATALALKIVRQLKDLLALWADGQSHASALPDLRKLVVLYNKFVSAAVQEANLTTIAKILEKQRSFNETLSGLILNRSLGMTSEKAHQFSGEIIATLKFTLTLIQ